MTLRLFWHVFSLESRRLMSYRADFWLTAFVNFFVNVIVAFALWEAIFAASGKSTIGGYDLTQMRLYYVAVTLLSGLTRSANFEGSVSTDIYEGTLTKYLLYPTRYFWFKYAQCLGMMLPGWVQLFLFGALVPFAFDLGATGISVASVAMGLSALLIANLLYFLLLYPLQGVAFWADNVWSLGVLLRFVAMLLGGMALPLSVFPQGMQEALYYLPFAYLYSFPTRTLLGEIGFGEWASGICICIVWCGVIAAIGHWVWRRGYRVYTGVGNLMRRYLRLYLYFLRFSFSRALEFRLDFFFRVVMDCAFYAVQLVFFHIIFDHTESLGGLDYDQTIIFVCSFLLLDAIHMTVFSNNMWWFPLLVNRGDLDYYLTRPVSALFFLSFREFAANSFLNLVIALGLVVWAFARYPDPISFGAIALYLALLLCGVSIYYGLQLCFLIPVFWMHNGHGLKELYFNAAKFAERPDQIFRGWLRRILLYVMPLSLVISLPVSTLFEETGVAAIVGHVLLGVVGVFTVVAVMWRAGLRSYASASS